MGVSTEDHGVHTICRNGPRRPGQLRPNEGTLGMITDVIDQNRCMVYSPSFDRKEMTYKRLSLTDLKVKIQREARTKTAAAAWTGADVEGQWSNTSWAKKRAAQKRKTTMSDLERYKAMVAKKK